MTVLYFLIGLCLLIYGADVLVTSSSKIAASFKISPLVVGLTVVAFGTSAPELAVSVQASLSGQDNIVIGNVVGSNIFNVLFILGLTALITPLLVARQLIKLEVPLLIVISSLLYILCLDGNLSQIEGIILFLGLVSYTVFIIYQSKKENLMSEEPEVSSVGSSSLHFWIKNTILVILGLAMLVYGSDLLIESVVKIARYFEISEEVIGLTVVAAGTSMPELVTSLLAAFKGKVDMAVGNILGSNVFNILGVAGLASAINKNGCKISPSIESFDIPVMIAVSILCLPIFLTERTISRFEGTVLFCFYGAYTTYLVLSSRGGGESLVKFNSIMLYGVIPLVVCFFIVGRVMKKKVQ